MSGPDITDIYAKNNYSYICCYGNRNTNKLSSRQFKIVRTFW